MPMKEKEIRDGMNGLAEDLRRQIPPDVGYVLILFSNVRDGTAWYAARATREQVSTQFDKVKNDLGIGRIIPAGAVG